MRLTVRIYAISAATIIGLAALGSGTLREIAVQLLTGLGLLMVVLVVAPLFYPVGEAPRTWRTRATPSVTPV